VTPAAQARDWMQESTALLLAAMGRLPDTDLSQPTALPGWTRAHVLAHVGFNAEALRRLASWARTGARNEMYASPEQRAAEIADGATWPADRLRTFVQESAEALVADLDGLSATDWRREVVTAQGRTVPATEIPWLRARDVAVHAVDLGAGVQFGHLPVGFCLALVADVAALRARRGDGPSLELTCPDGGSWIVQGLGEPLRVAGPPCDLAQWLTGRGVGGLVDPAGARVPELGPWI
jgi:maleylpyruvate isomerase